VTYLPVDEFGMVTAEDVRKAIKDTTILVTVMMANNEIGTIMPIEEIGKVTKESGVIFHTDAVQAIGMIDIDVNRMNIDLLSMTGHKFYGPKGIGGLYIRSGIKIEKLIIGGEQERTNRGGTTNVPAIVGMAKALEIAMENLDENNEYVSSLRNRFVEKVCDQVDEIFFNGPKEKDFDKRLPNNASFSFRYIEGESILYSLDLAGVCASSGSACSSGSLEPSRTLLAIGVPVGTAHGTIRFSFGKHNTVEQVDYAVEQLVSIVKRLRAMSPLYHPTTTTMKTVK
jgi:cysteine desulfurase